MSNEFKLVLCDAAVLPAQVSWGVRWDADTSGPRALMLAVLQEAVRSIEEGRRQRRFRAHRLAAEAGAWVRSDRADWPFSFLNICEVLGFDADALRARLLSGQTDAAPRGRVRWRSPIRRRTRLWPCRAPGTRLVTRVPSADDLEERSRDAS
jgi:hypothetical protein